MKLRSLGFAVAALGLATAPVAAQVAASDRSAPIVGANEVGGESSVLLYILGGIAIIAGIIIIADDNDDDPVSL